MKPTCVMGCRMNDKKISSKLLYKLIDMGFYPRSHPKRCYPGYLQKAQGAWAWTCDVGENHYETVGSTYSMADCVKSKNISRFHIDDQTTELIVEDYADLVEARETKKRQKILWKPVDNTMIQKHLRLIINGHR
jgi:hypothetical protein